MKFESWMHEIVHLTRVNEELSSEGNSPIVFMTCKCQCNLQTFRALFNLVF